jgi:hypothetical protein
MGVISVIRAYRPIVQPSGWGGRVEARDASMLLVHSKESESGNYTTLLMSTGLTFVRARR